MVLLISKLYDNSAEISVAEMYLDLHEDPAMSQTIAIEILFGQNLEIELHREGKTKESPTIRVGRGSCNFIPLGTRVRYIRLIRDENVPE